MTSLARSWGASWAVVTDSVQTTASLPTPVSGGPPRTQPRGPGRDPDGRVQSSPKALSPAHSGQEMLDSPPPALSSAAPAVRPPGASPLGFQAGKGTSPGEIPRGAEAPALYLRPDPALSWGSKTRTPTATPKGTSQSPPP